jgi:nitrogen regulatory protein P-II 1
MKELKAIIQPSMTDGVITALRQIPGLPGITISEVKGFGRRPAAGVAEGSREGAIDYVKKVKLEIVVSDELLEDAIAAIQTHARRGKSGDGKIFVYTVGDVIDVRTGEHSSGNSDTPGQEREI